MGCVGNLSSDCNGCSDCSDCTSRNLPSERSVCVKSLGNKRTGVHCGGCCCCRDDVDWRLLGTSATLICVPFACSLGVPNVTRHICRKEKCLPAHGHRPAGPIIQVLS